MAQNRKLSTVQAALKVLAYLAQHPEGLEAARVASFLGKSLSTAYALLASLVAEGFAERDGTTYKLAQDALAPAPAPQLAQPEKLTDALEELYLRTRERAFLALLTREGKLRLSNRGRQGMPKPAGLEDELSSGLHAMALGKAVLAHLDETALAPHLQALHPRTALTITDPLTLEDELAKVRQMGFAVEMEEFLEGLSSLASPLFGSDGRVIGAFGVVVPSRRFPYAFTRLLQAVQEVARAASSCTVEAPLRAESAAPRPLEAEGAGGSGMPGEVWERGKAPPALEPAHLGRSVEERKVYAPKALREAANLQDYAAEYAAAQADPEGFWADWAGRFEWFRGWEAVRELQPPRHGWFLGAQTNLTHNALDRHARGPKRNQLALVALSGDGKTHKLTYRELLSLVSRLAGGLGKLGVGPGDRVGVYMPSGLEAAVAMLACARLGAVHVAVSAGMSAAALRERLEDTEAKLLIAADRLYQNGRPIPLEPIVEEAVKGLPLRVLWHSRGTQGHPLEFWELLEAHAQGTPAVPVDAEHPLFILYTSGSTGKPKGVVHVHGGYMVGITYHLRQLYDLKDGEIVWSTADLSWIVGHSYGLYAPLLEGLTTVLREDRLDFPDPSSFYETLERHAVDVLLTSPTWLRTLRRHGAEWAERGEPRSLRLVSSVGEYLAPEVWHWASDHLAYVVDNWWQTETGGPALSSPLCLPSKPGKVGVPLPGAEFAVVDSAGRVLPAGEKGHLVIKQPFPHFMRGFWRKPDQYLEQWERIPGLYATGDLAVADAEGYIALLGRSDDVIKAGEQRIGTAEIEGALLSHPAVAEAAAIGVPDPIQGEVIKVYVVLKNRETAPEVQKLLADKLSTHLRRQLGPLSARTEVEFLGVLPRTKSGKIMRRVLKAQEQGADPGDLSTLEL